MGLFPGGDGQRFVVVHLVVHAGAVFGDDFNGDLGVLVVRDAFRHPFGVVGTGEGQGGGAKHGQQGSSGQQSFHRYCLHGVCPWLLCAAPAGLRQTARNVYRVSVLCRPCAGSDTIFLWPTVVFRLF